MASRETNMRPLLREGALYWADNGRVICAKCAGQSALYTGRDISGQSVSFTSSVSAAARPATSRA